MRGCLAGLVAVLLVSGPTSAGAQTEPEKALAQKRHKVGLQLYDISQFEKALVEFEEAYRLYPLPKMLHNIAMTHEALGNLDKAISNYRLFLEKLPESPNAPVVKTRINSLEDRLARKKKAAKEKATAAKAREKPAPLPPAKPEVKAEKPVPPPPVKPEMKEKKPAPVEVPAELTAPADTAHTWRWTAGLAGVGVGGAALVAGIAFSALAAGKNSEYEEQRDTTGTYADLKDLRGSGEQYQTVGIALMVAGGVIAAAGGGLLIWELMGDEEDTNSASAMFMPVVTQDGAGFAASLSF